MAHIAIPEGIPGIVGPMTVYPETAKPLNMLAEALLQTDVSITKAERELIAAFVSHRNNCYFCHNSHAAVAAYHAGDRDLVGQVCTDFSTAPVSDKMKALLTIAAKVQQGGLYVTPGDVDHARLFGADDRAIHDTVLIAAAFCMFNRYVDGLGTWAPRQAEVYEGIGERLAVEGYLNSIQPAAPAPEPLEA